MAALLCSLVALVMFVAQGTVGVKKNVLFIIADDLRPEIKFYHDQYVAAGEDTQSYMNIVTPNIDALAAKSIVFKRAYVQLPLCGPSRASFMVGRRPDTTGTHDLDTYWRDVAGDFETIPEHFKLNGYNTSGIGKIFHHGSASGNDDDAQSWTETYFHGVENFENKKKSWKSINNNKLATKDLIDKQLADEAISQLQTFANGSDPFFMALGFRKPHLPFVFPQYILDNYTASNVSLPVNDYVPADMPSLAWKNWGELRGYDDIDSLNLTGDENVTLPDATVLALRLAYYATITYMDEQLGRVLAELTTLGLENDTIVSLIGDHGFLLGEHGGWCKQTMFELATHTPMMISIPGDTDSGIVTDQLVEFVDLFPTLTKAAGLDELSLCPDNSTFILNCTEGISLLPLISNPNTALRTGVFSQQPRGNKMGYTIRTSAFRYTEWVKFDDVDFEPIWTNNFGYELYDLQTDYEENVNVEGESAYAANKTALATALHNGWRSAII